ncbi:MAG: putative manganese-dependent inorganic diphosphatase [Clostridiales bacterium]|nr:putative manganese-dependent inorganic diphosphatase [Clostridiales bacterium]
MNHAVTYVIGHKNPDTDTICSAIAYARLKEILTGRRFVPKRAGQLNGETRYVLRRFGVKSPGYLDTLEPRVSEIQIQETGSLTPELTLKEAWEQMQAQGADTQPVVVDGAVRGMVSAGDIACFYLAEQNLRALSASGARCRSIVDTLNGTLLLGEPERPFAQGQVIIATDSPARLAGQVQPGDLVITGDRPEVQRAALEAGAGWLVVCGGAAVAPDVLELAKGRDCVLLSTPCDSYAAARLVTQAVPVGHIMRTENLVSFREDEFVADIQSVMSRRRFRWFPVTDRNGGYVGLISRRDLMNLEKRQVILVDHNEKSQAVDGIGFAEVTEVIDHHRIGSTIETIHPVYFRNEPLGCTATIIAMLYKENDVKLDKTTAGLLLAAILSDTLAFRSPTSTPEDRKIAKKLAKRADVEIDELAMAMFQAGSCLDGKSEEEIFFQDFKTFQADPYRIGVGQVSTLGEEARDALCRRMQPQMAQVRARSRLDVVFLMLTDIMDESTLLLYEGEGGEEIVRQAFHVDCADGIARLPGVLSRKKQTVPSILAAIQRMENG